MKKTVALLAAIMVCMHMCAADGDLSAWMRVRSENRPKFPTSYVAPKDGSESLVRNALSFKAEEDVAQRSLPDSPAARSWKRVVDAQSEEPTGVSVTNGESVDISWNAVEGATSYSVWRAATNDSSKAQQIATVTDTSYADSAPAYYSQNYYWVKAVNDAGASGFSNSDCGYRYQANTYLLKYDANGGIGTMSDEILSTQGDSYLTKCAFTRVGYAFIGWATSSTGSSRYSEGDSTWRIAASQGSIVTLYAVWCAYDAEGFAIVNGVLRGYNGPGGDVVVPDTVQQIRAEVFAGNTSLTSVVLPSSVGFFGNNEFRGCTGLTNVVLGAQLRSWSSAFTDCPNVTSAVIPGDSWSANLSSTFPKLVSLRIADGSRDVAYGLCYGCEMLKEVVVPDGVSELDDYAFENCANLVHVELPQSVVTFGRGVFDGCPKLQLKFDLVIPDGTSWVQWSAYEGLTFITSVSLPGGYLSIERSAFEGCAGITNLVFRGSVSSIGSRAFAGCTGLRELALTNAFASVFDASIDNEAFLGCNGLTSVTIPEGVGRVGSRAFGNCANLVSATVLSTNCYWYGMYEVFQGCGKFTDLSVKLPMDGRDLAYSLDDIADNLLNLTIMSGATELPMRSLYNCRNVRTLTLPEGMTSIGSSAAMNCTSLEKVVFPSTLKVVGSGAFWNCTGLSEANLPQGVQGVGSYAFSGCKIAHPRIPNSVSDILWKAFGDVDLSDWTIDSGNPYLAVDSGLLYNILDGSRFRVLLASRQVAGKIELPASVTELQDYAFDGCEQLSEVIVPEGVVRMGSEVFANCTGLAAVRFLGNRPIVGPYMGQIEEESEDLYAQAADNLTSYVRRDKSGWTDETTGELPGDWQERPIAFWDETPVSTDVPVAVDHAWMEERWGAMRKVFPDLPETPNFESFAIAAKKPTGKVDAHGNPMYVWQDFVAGTDPTDKTSEFKASISFVDGKPVITWTPDLNEGGAKSLRTYRTLGIDDLSQSADPAAWREVAPGAESDYKFFKVKVELK